jgi:heme exporter protein C
MKNSQVTTGFNWLKYASPKTFYPIAGKVIPWCVAGAVILIAYGLYLGLLVAPTDFQQGEGYRIIFVHVPAAWFSMFLYLLMAMYAALGLILNAKLSHMMAKAIAPTGAMFTVAALVTGAFWGKPMWGAWWVWDARLTSELILLFLYIGYFSLQSAIDDKARADKASAILAIVGAVNVPIIYFSVKWWNTLHQGSSISMTKAPAMAALMLQGMLIMAIGFWLYSIAVILVRVRCEIVERDHRAAMIKQGL